MAEDDMWRPPTNRLMSSLDRSFFQRTINLHAARVFQNQNIFKVRSALEKSKDALTRERLGSVHPDPDVERAKAGMKCILLRPEVATNESSNSEVVNPNPHSSVVTELAQQGLISIIPYQLKLDYDYWTYHDIMSSILPEDEQGEIPSGFSQVGHVAHLNLRDEYVKYKHIIAEILMDKNPGVRTVINKIDDVGEESEYRTFKYEVLAGPDDLNVTISEENCTFKFDYSKVYWNSRLNTEHRRLVSSFAEGEAVCDVMAGIGPFAVPAGKKRIFVWANDLNPDSYTSMLDAIKRNKVQDYVRPFNEDGRLFIRTAVAELAKTDYAVDIMSKPSRKDKDAKAEVVKSIKQPRTFQHFVMNLPATATTFLPSFIGLYPPSVREMLPADAKMPLIHVYCFSTKSDDNVEEGYKICEELSNQLQCDMKPGKISEGKVEIHDVRDVAPKKRMFCASFRLPEEVAFRDAPA
ncbi:tRNA (guanine(37)-N1)-methyltransferase [Pseudocercospora fuligena]|uniref:tRNA (guanine(37)-N1)-methyltransferase n=1 Tax=Pseudocercospora fuligena TaxID=685502 RepID=A0A8H6RSK6_9PEZI|nr:tRNA (guanine(37)-N1)-methyltransferase [Pseudocercospora fuligena]